MPLLFYGWRVRDVLMSKKLRLQVLTRLSINGLTEGKPLNLSAQQDRETERYSEHVLERPVRLLRHG